MTVAVKRQWRSYSEHHAEECGRPNHDQDGSVVDGSDQEVGAGRSNHTTDKVAHPPASLSRQSTWSHSLSPYHLLSLSLDICRCESLPVSC